MKVSAYFAFLVHFARLDSNIEPKSLNNTYLNIMEILFLL